jgi:hypothetical protein
LQHTRTPTTIALTAVNFPRKTIDPRRRAFCGGELVSRPENKFAELTAVALTMTAMICNGRLIQDRGSIRSTVIDRVPIHKIITDGPECTA